VAGPLPGHTWGEGRGSEAGLAIGFRPKLFGGKRKAFLFSNLFINSNSFESNKNLNTNDFYKQNKI
jgi:hypothetical protein